MILAALLLLSASLTPAQEDPLQRSFHAGQRAMQEGNFANAVEEFKKVLTLDPNLVEGQVNLGLAYQSLSQYDLAVRYLAKGLHQRPDLLGPTVIVGIDYLKLGSPEKAVPYLQQALKLDPSNRDANNALASAYLIQENFGAAAEQYDKIASLEPDKAEALYKLGHESIDLAARLAYRGANRYRESAWGHRFLGDLLFQRDRWEDAIKEYQKALAADSQQPGLHNSLGETYLRAGKLPDAEKECQLELQLEPKSESALMALAKLRLAANQPASALDSLQRVWEISPQYLAVQRDFPSIQLPGPALTAAINTVQPLTESPAKHFLLAALYTAAEQAEPADREWRTFQDAVSKQPPRTLSDASHLKALTDAQKLVLGKAHFRLQEYEPASRVLAQITGFSPANAEASYWLARSYQALGAEAYAKVQELFPRSSRAYQLRAEGFAFRGAVANAIQELQVALALYPNLPDLHEALAEVHIKYQQDPAVAESELKRTLELDPARSYALYLLGRLYIMNKENEKALPVLQQAVRLQPDLSEANSLLGTAYLRLSQYADAIAPLEKAAPTDHYGNVHYQLSLAYRKLGRAELARKELTLSQELRRNYLEHDEAVIMGAPQPQPDVQ